MKIEGNGLVFKKLKRGTGSSENNRNSTTPDKEIRLCSMVLFIYVLNSTPPHLQFFLFSTQLFTLVSMILSPDFWSCKSCFFSASIQRRQHLLCLLCASCKLTWREEPHHHLMAGILSLTQMVGMRC